MSIIKNPRFIAKINYNYSADSLPRTVGYVFLPKTSDVNDALIDAVESAQDEFMNLNDVLSVSVSLELNPHYNSALDVFGNPNISDNE